MVEIEKLRTNYKLRFGYNKRLIDYIKSLPKDHQQTKVDRIQKEDGTTVEDWYRIVSDVVIGKILSFLKDNGITFKFINLTTEESQQLSVSFQQRKKEVENILKLKAESINVDGVDFSFMKKPPYKYQKQAVIFFENCGGKAMLGDEPGVGKTLPVITYAIKNKLKTLIICPASLKLNWRNEITRFSNEKYYIFKYKPKKNSSEITYTKEESLFHIINYEGLETYIKFITSHKCSNIFCKWESVDNKRKHDTCPKCLIPKSVKSRIKGIEFVKDKDGIELNVKDYDLVALDESHYIKSQNISRTKIIKSAFTDTSKKILLTGTAIKNRPFEFFSQLNFLDPKEWKNSHTFGINYCAGFQSNFGWNYDGASNLEELFDRISPYFLRRLKKDVLSFLPPKTYTNIPIELTNEEYREYRKLEGKIIDETEETDDDMTHLSRIQKLKQFTSMVKMKNVAFDLIQNIIDSDNKIVVFTQYISIAEELGKHFGNIGVVFTGKKTMEEKQKAVDDFMNNDSVKVFIGTSAAKEGITLTSASNLLFIDEMWSPADREQFSSRIHRASATADKIQIITLICQETIDEDINRLLNEKEYIVTKVLDGIELDNSVSRETDGSIFKELIKIILSKKQQDYTK